jgi:putative phage-type endonuclease
VTYSVVCHSSDREAWLRARRTGVGASEAACLVGEDPRRSLVQLYLGKVSEDPPEDRPAEWLEWGLRHERSILEAYRSERYAYRHTSADGRLLRCDQHPWALATLDAWAVQGAALDGPMIPLELKTAEVWHADAWEYGCPRSYWWQLQHQMLVTGAPAASIACLLGVHRLVWCDVERDEQAIERLIRAGERFWGYVERREIPPGPLDAASLTAAYPRSEPSTVQLNGEWIDKDALRERVRFERDEAQRLLDEIDNEMRGAIGRYERAVLPNNVIYTLKTNKRGARPLCRIAPKE